MSKRLVASLTILGGLLSLTGPVSAQAQYHEHHGLTITMPAPGATVSGPVTVSFGFGGGDREPTPDGQSHGRQGHGPRRQVFLLIDQPPPAAGASSQADPMHIAFPEGQMQMNVTLPPGKHSLQLAVLDRDGKVGDHFHPADPVAITVQ